MIWRVILYCWLGANLALANLPRQSGAWLKTNETRFLYDRMLVIQERDTNNNPLVTYTRGLDLSLSLQGAGGIGGLLARTDANGSTFYHCDGLGNVTALIDENQNIVARYEYDAFGKLIGKWGAYADLNTYRFSSKEFQRNGGIYGYGRRFYEPNFQRWLNRDPIQEAGGINLYGYVHSSPLNANDPTGLSWFSDLWDSVFGDSSADNAPLTTPNSPLSATPNSPLSNTPNSPLSHTPNTPLECPNQPLTPQKPDPLDAAANLVQDLGLATMATAVPELIPEFADVGGWQLLEESTAEGITPTSEDLITISEHLATVDAMDPEFAMYSRLTTAFENGGMLTGTDATFDQHELIESPLVDSGMEQWDAHLETLNLQGIPNTPGVQAQLYNSSVIQQFPASFNSAARAAAGVR